MKELIPRTVHATWGEVPERVSDLNQPQFFDFSGSEVGTIRIIGDFSPKSLFHLRPWHEPHNMIWIDAECSVGQMDSRLRKYLGNWDDLPPKATEPVEAVVFTEKNRSTGWKRPMRNDRPWAKHMGKMKKKG